MKRELLGVLTPAVKSHDDSSRRGGRLSDSARGSGRARWIQPDGPEDAGPGGGCSRPLGLPNDRFELEASAKRRHIVDPEEPVTRPVVAAREPCP